MPLCPLGHTICGGCGGSTCHYCENEIEGEVIPPGGCELCRKTKETCTCFSCTGCAKKKVKGKKCQLCVKCDVCCECPRCARCSKVDDNLCEDCDKCVSCCSCRKVRFVNRNLVWHKNSSRKLNPSGRFISLEPEIYSCVDFRHIGKVCKKWGMSVVHDGSIGNSYGFEINTSPAQSDSFVQQISELGEALDKGRASVEATCGCHVHIDTRNVNFWEIKKLVDLYTLLEPGLYQIVQKDRIKNRYCTPCGQNFMEEMLKSLKTNPKDIKNAFTRAVYKKDKEESVHIGANKYDDSRYSALNLHSRLFRGTVECRIHHGTTSPEEMINWGILWASIVDYAVRQPKFTHLPSNSLEALIEVAPTVSLKDWIEKQKNLYNPKSVVKKKFVSSNVTIEGPF